MEEKQHKPTFAEMVAQWTGRPVREPKERKPMTEEQRRKWEEFMQKTQNLSKEEFQKMFFGDQDESTSTEKDK